MGYIQFHWVPLGPFVIRTTDGHRVASAHFSLGAGQRHQSDYRWYSKILCTLRPSTYPALRMMFRNRPGLLESNRSAVFIFESWSTKRTLFYTCALILPHMAKNRQNRMLLYETTAPLHFSALLLPRSSVTKSRAQESEGWTVNPKCRINEIMKKALGCGHLTPCHRQKYYCSRQTWWVEGGTGLDRPEALLKFILLCSSVASIRGTGSETSGTSVIRKESRVRPRSPVSPVDCL